MEHDGNCFRVVGMDPGSRSLGIAVLDYYPSDGMLCLEKAWTFKTNPVVANNKDRVETYGEMFVRLEAIYDHVLETLSLYRPDHVISESPYMQKHAQAYSVLVQVLAAIASGVHEYSASLVLDKIDPSTVKASLGVPGNSPDKSLMQKAIMSLRYFENRSSINLSELDEHSIDGIGVGHYYCRSALGLRLEKCA